MPAFTHALLLRRGKVAEAGPMTGVLTSAALSQIFGEQLTLRRNRQRYQLDVAMQ
jgi:iron complex transport system ATP-binding protein